MEEHDRPLPPATRVFVIYLVPALIVIVVALGVYPEWRSGIRAKNERAAFAALKAIAAAEAVFRANDRDGNRVNDYWTADLAALYRHGLIDRGIAEADVRPLAPLVPRPVPFRGYFFGALRADGSRAYTQDTDGTSGPVHNLHRFGFVAYPAEPGSTGNFHFLINEDNTVFRCPSTLPLPSEWPRDDDLRNSWSKPQ